MIIYPENNANNDLFSDTIITDAELDSGDNDEMTTIDVSIGNNRKIALHRYLARHKIEQRQERLRLRELLEEF